jgi:hypothetical protein
MRRFCILILAATTHGMAALINGGFDSPVVSGNTPFTHSWDNGRIRTYDASYVLGWQTTDTGIEIWSDGAYGFSVFPGYNQWAEINAHTDGTLSQIISGINAGEQFGFAFAHRGRTSATVPDVLRMYVVDLGPDNAVGGGDDIVLLSQLFAATNVAWSYHTVNLGIRSNNNLLQLSFGAVSTANGNKSTGNFITAVSLAQGVGIPEPGSAAMAICGASLVALARLRRGVVI